MSNFEEIYLGFNNGEELEYIDKFMKPNCKIINVNNFDESQCLNEFKHIFNIYNKHPDVKIYEKTDYLCNFKANICVHNINAELLRKIYDGNSYTPDKKYVSFIIQ
jgi:hypothetical protein